MDAIMVGAETIRLDNPSLITRRADCAAYRRHANMSDHPIKVTVTASGRLDPAAAFFTGGETEKIVLAAEGAEISEALQAAATVLRFEGDWWPVLEEALTARGADKLMVEGGANLLHQLVDRRRADRWRIAVSDKVLGDAGRAKAIDPAELEATPARGVYLSAPQDIGGMNVYWMEFEREVLQLHAWMEKAFGLAAMCPPSQTAYSVGAIALDARGRQIAKGYSRQSAPNNHAEEELLANIPADAEPIDTLICTLEPCDERSSKPTGCAAHLISAGVRRVVIGVTEPGHFVAAQSGVEALQAAGIEVVELDGYGPEFAALHTHLGLET